jgi:hypothetical protein
MWLGQIALWASETETIQSRKSWTARNGKSQRGEATSILIIFAEILYALGEYYNEAFIIVENNCHGILTCTRLVKDYGLQQLLLWRPKSIS